MCLKRGIWIYFACFQLQHEWMWIKQMMPMEYDGFKFAHLKSLPNYFMSQTFCLLLWSLWWIKKYKSCKYSAVVVIIKIIVLVKFKYSRTSGCEPMMHAGSLQSTEEAKELLGAQPWTISASWVFLLSMKIIFNVCSSRGKGPAVLWFVAREINL